MRKILLVGALFMNVLAFSQTNKEAKVQELIKVCRVDAIGMQTFNKMIDIYKENYKHIPAEFWDDFRNEITNEDLVQLYTPIYSKYYSENDLDELLKFYKSPIGEKVISVTPSLLQESMEAGRKLGEKIGQKVMDKIKENKNIELPPPPMTSKQFNNGNP